jgi:sRNA-binding carbon storage regulator CsrA
MLVLSRRVNEAVVLADRLIVTVVRLLPESVELILQEATGGPSTFLKLGRQECVDLGLGTRLTLVEVRMITVCAGTTCGGPKARLGFEAPPTISVVRKEVWDVIGSRGPGWYFPGAVVEPSPN